MSCKVGLTDKENRMQLQKTIQTIVRHTYHTHDTSTYNAAIADDLSRLLFYAFVHPEVFQMKIQQEKADRIYEDIIS